MYDGMFWGMHFMWWIFFIVVLVWLFTARHTLFRPPSRTDSPLDILKQRFARGEINKEEYEERRRVLENEKSLEHESPLKS